MSSRLDHLFYQYLLDRRLISQGDLLDDGLANLDDSGDKKGGNQDDDGRVLLDVERVRREQKLAEEARDKAILDTLSKKLNEISAKQTLISLRENADTKLDAVVNRPFLDILAISLYRNLSIKQLASAITARPITEKRLIELARSHEMSQMIGKRLPGGPRPNLANTIGYMGLDNARIFSFLVTAKPLRMIAHEQFPNFQRKLWRFCLTSGFILRDLTADSGIDPQLAFYAGVLPGLSGMLVLDEIDNQFTENKRLHLSRFRDNQRYKEYNALIDANLSSANVALTLPDGIAEFRPLIFERMKRSLSQTRQTFHLVEQLPRLEEKLPIAQQVAEVWMLERSNLASTEKLLSFISQHNVDISTELSRFASMKTRISLADYLPLVPQLD